MLMSFVLHEYNMIKSGFSTDWKSLISKKQNGKPNNQKVHIYRELNQGY